MHIDINIKQGTKVKIKDGSYMLAVDIDQNNLTGFPLRNKNHNLVKLNHIYTVVAINVPCPTDNIGIALSSMNNCIIKDNSNNIIWFCSKINLTIIESLI